MTNEWTELKSLQEVAAAVERGDEIEYCVGYDEWEGWSGKTWFRETPYRSRPRKKTIVLREALFFSEEEGYWRVCGDESYCESDYFVRWLDTPAREVEVEE